MFHLEKSAPHQNALTVGIQAGRPNNVLRGSIFAADITWRPIDSEWDNNNIAESFLRVVSVHKANEENPQLVHLYTSLSKAQFLRG